MLSWGYLDLETATKEYVKKSISDELLFTKFQWVKKVRPDDVIIFGTALETVIYSKYY